MPPPVDVDRYWQMFLRRFDIEHTFRLSPGPRGPGARVSEPPYEDLLSGGCAETVPTGSRAATRLEEPETRRPD